MVLRQQFWRLSRFLGPRAVRWAWDDQFRTGHWNGLRVDRDQVVTDLVEEFSRGGDILELGCGEGLLIASINPSAYSSYVGWDLSEVAIARARERIAELGLRNCEFSRGEFFDWKGASALSLEVMEECLYYLNPVAQTRLLERCFAALLPTGLVLVTVHSKQRHAATLEVCRRSGTVKRELGDGERAILMLAPRVAERPAA